jgi:aspartate/methionine/tyrosine aminotransferase
VLTAGTSEAYAHLFRLLADPGGRFLVPRRVPAVRAARGLEGIELGRYRLAFDGAWHLDRASLERAFAGGARGVIVVQPNHPTGSCLAARSCAHESLCAAHGAAIVSDEVFGDFPWPPAQAPLPSLLGPRRVPTFVLSGSPRCAGCRA